MRIRYFFYTAALGCSLLGCSETSKGDSADDSFLSSGKADALGVSEDSPEAAGILALVNEVRYRVLNDDAGLTSTASWNIVMHRAGPDEYDHTADDDPFDTLAELDEVKYVGPVAFEKLLDYAVANGYVQDRAGDGGSVGTELMCGESTFSDPSGDLSDDARDSYYDCWHEETLCYRGDVHDASDLVDGLFEVLWSGDRLSDEGATVQGAFIELSSYGEDGERTITVEPCQ